MLTKDDVKQAAKDGVNEALEDLYVDRQQHHDDHNFVKGVRKGVATSRTAGIYFLTISLFGLVIWVFKTAFTSITGVTP